MAAGSTNVIGQEILVNETDLVGSEFAPPQAVMGSQQHHTFKSKTKGSGQPVAALLGPDAAQSISSGATPLVSSSEFNRSVGHQIKLFNSLTPGP